MTKSTILIVDDERVLTAAYELILTKAGYEVYVANHPQEGLTLAKSNKPDVLLLDMLMPGMNGIEFLEAMKRDKIHINNVIVFTNIDNPDLIKAAKKLGVQAYLLKSNYSPLQVADMVQNVVGGHNLANDSK